MHPLFEDRQGRLAKRLLVFVGDWVPHGGRVLATVGLSLRCAAMGHPSPIKRHPPTPWSVMSKLLSFKRPSDDYGDVVEVLSELAAEERAERDCEWLEEAVRRAMEIPRLGGAPHRKNDRCLDRK